MTTNLEEVLAEEWEAVEGRILTSAKHDGAFGEIVDGGYGYDGGGAWIESDEHDKLRAAVAVLGKRTLAAMLKRFPRPERDCILCAGYQTKEREDANRAALAADEVADEPFPPYGYAGSSCRPDCEWGRIVAAAKEIG